jgi:hypothetical protein
MKTVGVTGSGSVLVEMNVRELRGLKAFADGLAEIAASLPEVACGDDGVVTIPAKIHPPARKKTTKGTKGTKAAKKGSSGVRALPAQGAKKAEKRSRNKKCVTCNRAFFDDTRTNCRKFCGPAGCKFDADVAGGRTSPETDPLESARKAAGL